jgi:hypothetical protein
MLAASLGAAQAREHVYLFRGLADVFSLGMNTLADQLNERGVYATAHSHTDWKPLADKAIAAYKAGKERPIILIGHSLGADAVMLMADYLGDRGVPVALLVPFDATQSFPVPGNVGRCINFTQRDYAHMRSGPGFRGSLSNVDLSSDSSIGHTNIDKVPRLHARVIDEVLAIVGGRGGAAASPKPASPSEPSAKGAEGHGAITPAAEGGIKQNTAPPAAPPSPAPPQNSAVTPQPAPRRVHPVDQIPD